MSAMIPEAEEAEAQIDEEGFRVVEKHQEVHLGLAIEEETDRDRLRETVENAITNSQQKAAEEEMPVGSLILVIKKWVDAKRAAVDSMRNNFLLNS